MTMNTVRQYGFFSSLPRDKGDVRGGLCIAVWGLEWH
jgi:hypothetical protein